VSSVEEHEKAPGPRALRQLGRLYWSPATAFSGIEAGPRPWIPLVGLLVVWGTATLVWLAHTDPALFLQSFFERFREFPQAQQERMLARAQFAMYWGAGLDVLWRAILQPAGVAIGGCAVVRLVGSRTASWPLCLSVVAWAFLATAVPKLLLASVRLTTHDEWNKPLADAGLSSLYDFLPYTDSIPHSLVPLLDSVDVFTLWTGWIVCQGLAVIAGRPVKLVFGWMFGLWMILIAGRTALALLAARAATVGGRLP